MRTGALSGSALVVGRGLGGLGQLVREVVYLDGDLRQALVVLLAVVGAEEKLAAAQDDAHVSSGTAAVAAVGGLERLGLSQDCSGHVAPAFCVVPGTTSKQAFRVPALVIRRRKRHVRSQRTGKGP